MQIKDMDFITNKFGAMFAENEDGEYELYDVFLVDYNISNNRFLIRTGPSKYVNNEAFNVVTSSPDDLFSPNSSVTFDDFYDDCEIVVLFDDDYIDKIGIKKNHDSELQTFTYLANELSKIRLHKNLDGSIFTKEGEQKIIYTEESLNDLLFGEENNITPEEFEKLAPYHLGISDEQLASEGTFESNNIIDFLDCIVFGRRGSDLFLPATQKEKTNDEKIKEEIEKLRNLIKVEEEKKLEEKRIDTKKVIYKTAKKIVGQEEAIRTLVNQIFNNQMIIHELSKNGDLDITELDARKTSILLDGETGTGKTAIIKDICKQLDLPVVIASSTNFSGTGYVGASITDLLIDLLKQSNNDLNKAERGIIVFDEIDKLAFSKEAVIGKDMKEEVQHELLTFIGGGEYDVPIGEGFFSQNVKFNTSKITFILSGAFTDLREYKIKEVDKSHKAMGFSTESSDNYEKEYIVTPDDYIKYGLMREFFGRIKVLASTKSYSLEDCKRILLESTISPLLNFEKNVKMYGYPGIEYNEDFLNKVSEEGMKMKTGARGLQTVISGIQNNMLNGLINNEYDINKPIVLDTKMIEDYKKSFIRKF